MGVDESTARGRELGGELKKFRERADLSGHALAMLLGWSPSKVSRMESGQRRSTEVDVAVYLARCGAPRPEIDRLLELAGESDVGYRLQGHGERLADELRSLIVLETTADAIIGFEPGVIPGLLQTEEYIRELLRWGRSGEDSRFELLVTARLERQRILRRRWPPQLALFIHENALRAVVGGPRVMHEQLVHLTLLSNRARCQLRVTEASAAPVGIFGSGFYVMRFAEHRPVAYAQTHTATVLSEDSEDMRVYQAVVNDLAAMALDPAESREWLATLASEYDRAEATRDAPPAPPRIGLA